MNILFVTPEVAPYSGSSPVGETCCALPKALKGLGHQVTVLSPLYGFVDAVGRGLARRLRKVEVALADRTIAFEVYDARSSAGVEHLFLGHEELLRPCKELPTSASHADGVRFGTFCKAAIEVMRQADPPFDVVCAHDWQMGLVPALLSTEPKLAARSVLHVHDASRHGLFPAALHAELALPPRLFGIQGVEFYGQLGFLKGGIVTAQRVVTPSLAYAAEATREGGAGGLEGALRARGKDLVGITGGVDGALWNPATDAHLESRFDPMDLSGKRRSKVAFQRQAGLPLRDDVALIAAPGWIAPEGGFDALARVLSRVMRSDVQLVIAGEPDREPEAALLAVLEEHQRRWADRLHVIARADSGALHRLIGASDAVLVAAASAPGCTLQMKAHRYGSLPIGVGRGAFADSVVDCDAHLETGTGFLIDDASDEALLAGLQRAVACYAKRSSFEALRQRAMRIDHSWERSAYQHDRLYRSLVS